MRYLKKYQNYLLLESSKELGKIIPKSIFEIHKLFQKSGKKLYLVGGCVRDFLIGSKPKDFDLATDAQPQEVVEILKDYQTQLQGEAFGVVVVRTKDQPAGMEIATFREDLYDSVLGKTRNPSVKFSTIEKDVQRRDLSINGLFYDLDKSEIVDLVGGTKDIDNKVVRMIGDPGLRIQEDPLRILRVLRFAFRYDFTIDPETEAKIIEMKDTLDIISRERIWEEIKKSFDYTTPDKNFKGFLELMNQMDLWDSVFRGISFDGQIELKNFENFECHIASIFRNDKTFSEQKLVQRMKIDLRTARIVAFLIDAINLQANRFFELNKQMVRSTCTTQILQDWFEVNHLNSNVYKAFLIYQPSTSGDDLIKLGYKGREIGEKQKEIETQKATQLIKTV